MFLAGSDGKRSTFALPYYVGLVKGAPHADNGKKLIDWLLSKPAQRTLPDVALGLPVRTDVQATEPAAEQIMGVLKGVEIWTPDWMQVSDDLSKDVARWARSHGQLGRLHGRQGMSRRPRRSARSVRLVAAPRRAPPAV